MDIRTFAPVVLAAAFGCAMGTASAQQYDIAAGTDASTPPTPAAAKTAVDIQGNAALTSETAVAGRPIQGKPGTQSGVAVTDTTSMGAPGARFAMGAPETRFTVISSRSFPALSRSQLLALQRHEALR